MANILTTEENVLTPYGDTGSVRKIVLEEKATYIIDDINIINNETYTFSIWHKSDSEESTVDINLFGYYDSFNTYSNWTKYVKTFKVTKYDENKVIKINLPIGTSYLYHAFLTDGSKDTSWTPAPEDTESKIANSISDVEDRLSSVIDYENMTITDEALEKVYLYEPILDENGNIQYDTTKPVYDKDGNPVTDESGNPVYEILKQQDAYNIIERNAMQQITLDNITQIVESSDLASATKKVSEIEQTADKIELVVESTSLDGDNKTQLTLTDSAINAVTKQFEIMSPDGERTIVQGGKIATDAIKSNNYTYTSGNFSDSGSLFDLENGLIRSQNFAIDSDGNAYFKGNIDAYSGRFGNYEYYYDIGENGLIGTHIESYKYDLLTLSSDYGDADDLEIVTVSLNRVDVTTLDSYVSVYIDSNRQIILELDSSVEGKSINEILGTDSCYVSYHVKNTSTEEEWLTSTPKQAKGSTSSTKYDQYVTEVNSQTGTELGYDYIKTENLIANTSGSIGGWIIDSSSLKSSSTATYGSSGIVLSPTSGISVKDIFEIDTDGQLYSKEALFGDNNLSTGFRIKDGIMYGLSKTNKDPIITLGLIRSLKNSLNVDTVVSLSYIKFDDIEFSSNDYVLDYEAITQSGGTPLKLYMIVPYDKVADYNSKVKSLSSVSNVIVGFNCIKDDAECVKEINYVYAASSVNIANAVVSSEVELGYNYIKTSNLIANGGTIGGINIIDDQLYCRVNISESENGNYTYQQASISKYDDTRSINSAFSVTQYEHDAVEESDTNWYNFYVTYDGKMYSNNAEILGGNIGGWTIGTDAIYNGTNSSTSTTEGLYLGNDHIRGYTDESHYFDFDKGILTCTGANISGTIVCGDNFSVSTDGTINALKGNIGNLTIDGNSVSVENSTLKYTFDDEGIKFYDVIDDGWYGRTRVESNNIYAEHFYTQFRQGFKSHDMNYIGYSANYTDLDGSLLNTSVTGGSWTDLANITLSYGTWIIFANISFGNISDDNATASGSQQIAIVNANTNAVIAGGHNSFWYYKGSTTGYTVCCTGLATGHTYETTTYTLRGYSTQTRSASITFFACKIC